MSDRLERGQRAKRGIVSFLTNGKVIQAFLTGSAFAILGTGATLVGVTLAPVVPYISALGIKWVLIVATAAFWYWADRNQARFRDLVEDAAGESDE